MVLSQLPKLERARQPFEAEEGKLKDQRGYGKWISNNFPNLLLIINRHDQAAIIWAAKSNVVNTTMVPSQGEHADAIGVSRNFPNLRNTVSKSCLMKTLANGAIPTSQT